MQTAIAEQLERAVQRRGAGLVQADAEDLRPTHAPVSFTRFRKPPGLKVSAYRSGAESRSNSPLSTSRLAASRGPGPKPGPDGMAVQDRVLEDDVGADRNQLAVVFVERHQARQLVCREDQQRMRLLAGELAHLRRGLRLGRVAPHVLDPRMLDQVRHRVVVDRDHAAVTDQFADRGQEEGAPAATGTGLDDPVGPHAVRSAPDRRTGRSAAVRSSCPARASGATPCCARRRRRTPCAAPQEPGSARAGGRRCPRRARA